MEARKGSSPSMSKTFTLGSGGVKKSDIQVKRTVKVKRFDPTLVSPTRLDVASPASPQSPYSPPSSSTKTGNQPFFDTGSAHVKVSPSKLPDPRWPPRPIRRKDIESKPWYMWSFDEATEFYLGDEIRAERYGTYNKSFVTRLDSATTESPEKIAFGTKVNNVSNNITAKALKSANRQGRPGSAPQATATDAKSTSSRRSSDDAVSVVTSATSRTSVVRRHHSEVEADIRQRKMKVTELLREIENVKQQHVELEKAAKKEHAQVQAAIQTAEQSDKDLRTVEVQALKVISAARSGVMTILQQRQDQQDNLRELMDRQRQELRRMSVGDNSGGKRQSVQSGQRSTVSWQDTSAQEFSPVKIHERNIGSYMQRLDAEARRNEVRAAVRRGLRRFALAQKAKKKPATVAKKTVRIV